jgi:hypothetical protein
LRDISLSAILAGESPKQQRPAAISPHACQHGYPATARMLEAAGSRHIDAAFKSIALLILLSLAFPFSAFNGSMSG